MQDLHAVQPRNVGLGVNGPNTQRVIAVPRLMSHKNAVHPLMGNKKLHTTNQTVQSTALKFFKCMPSSFFLSSRIIITFPSKAHTHQQVLTI